MFDDFDLTPVSSSNPFSDLREKMRELETLVHEGSNEEVSEVSRKLSAMVLEVAGLDPSKTAMNQSALEFRALLDDGKQHKCGVCLRKSRIWPRHINQKQCLCMIALEILWDGSPEGVLSSDIEGWIRKRYPDAGAHPTGDMGKLFHWGLMHQPLKTDDDGGGKTSGRWVPEPKMTDFLRGKIKIRKWKKLLNNVVVEISEDFVHITDEFPKFDFDALMNP